MALVGKHHRKVFHAAQVGQEAEPKCRVVVERAHDVGHGAGRDADLGRVVALRDRPGQVIGKGGLQTALQGGVDGDDSLGRLRRRPERSAR